LEASLQEHAAYYASRDKGLIPSVPGHLGEFSAAEHLVFVGDPERGIPSCTACHGPDERKLGAPPLLGQQPAYIERQLAAFTQGMRQNDIDRQMSTVAAQLKPEEMRDLANFYSGDVQAQLAKQ
jgi:cytochrome c553